MSEIEHQAEIQRLISRGEYIGRKTSERILKRILMVIGILGLMVIGIGLI